MYKNKHQAAIQIQKIWRGYYIRETYIKKIRRLYEKIILQMENVCCLPEALVEIEWKHRNKLCRPNLSAPSSPPKKSTKTNKRKKGKSVFLEGRVREKHLTTSP